MQPCGPLKYRLVFHQSHRESKQAAKKPSVNQNQSQFVIPSPNWEVCTCGLICWLRSGWGFQLWCTAQFSLPITYNKSVNLVHRAARHKTPPRCAEPSQYAGINWQTTPSAQAYRRRQLSLLRSGCTSVDVPPATYTLQAPAQAAMAWNRAKRTVQFSPCGICP